MDAEEARILIIPVRISFYTYLVNKGNTEIYPTPNMGGS